MNFACRRWPYVATQSSSPRARHSGGGQGFQRGGVAQQSKSPENHPDAGHAAEAADDGRPGPALGQKKGVG